MQLTAIFVTVLPVLAALVSAGPVAPSLDDMKAAAAALAPIDKRALWDCEDPTSPCTHYDDEKGCQRGYAACLERMGCGGKAQDLDCVGTSLGT